VIVLFGYPHARLLSKCTTPFAAYWKFVQDAEGARSYQMWSSQTERFSVSKSSRKTWW
jgi:hypothetical protein